MKILIADDNPAMRSFLRCYCAEIATEMRDCSNGHEAIRAFAEFQPDWTLMDLTMPGVDGLALARMLRAQGFVAPLLAVTARSDASAEAQAREAGFDDFLRKPITGAQLTEALAAALRR